MTTNTTKLLTPREAAEYLGVRADSLAVWRCTGRYPLPFIRVGRSIKYRASDLEQFLCDRTVIPTAVA